MAHKDSKQADGKAEAKRAKEKLQLGDRRRLHLTGRVARDPYEPEPAITNMMMDARYLRQSASLVQDALQKGFDVLQLANGDIVTTGTKTIVYQYTWDEDRGKLVRMKLEPKKRPTDAPLEDADVEEREEEDA
ncbi:MAG: DUF2671 domain-containing protein [Alphaproteobacteria bacterium]|nr:DUF2671 domain-containing protein [Alphaproteobacteria bacterium]